MGYDDILIINSHSVCRTLQVNDVNIFQKDRKIS